MHLSSLRISPVMVVILWACSAWCWAEPLVDHLEPAGICRGRQNTIVFAGRQLGRPIGVWTSLPPGKLKFISGVARDDQRAEVTLELAADCPLGIYGLRLAAEDGLSNCLLFLVDDLEPRVIPTGSETSLPVSISGGFKSGEVDRFAIKCAAGERVAFEAVASRLGTDADPLITIFDAQGKRVLRRDNNPGLFFDTRFEHLFEREGTYTVEIRDARFLGSPNWRYLLRIGKFPAAHVALPAAVLPGRSAVVKFPELPGTEASVEVPGTSLGTFYHDFRRPDDDAGSWFPLTAAAVRGAVEQEPNDSIDDATPLTEVPALAEGNLREPGDRDYFSCLLKKGDKLYVKATTKLLQSPADVEISVLDAAGKELQRSDDIPLPGGASDEGAFNFTAGQDGKYVFLIREMTGGYGPEYTYRLEIQPAAPRVQVSTDIAATTLPQGSHQSLPMSVIRTDYNGPLELTLVDPPAGVTLEPTIIPEGENILLAKLRATSASPLGLHSLAIRVQGGAGETACETTVVFQPLIDKQFINADLQKFALRDNQRLLPPSLQRQFALQITPPIPYQVEPEEALVVLPRYHQTALKVQTPRIDGFDGAISFSAAGGQLGEESQGRRQVFSRFPTGLKGTESILATFHSRSQAQELKERVDIVSEAKVGERRVSLLRSIMLQVKPAFEVEMTPAQATLLPGEKVTIVLTANRLPSFHGPIEVTTMTNAPLTVPDSLTIPPDGKVEVQITVPADYKPRRDKIRFIATGSVNGFLEEPRPREFDLEVKAPPPAAAK